MSLDKGKYHFQTGMKSTAYPLTMKNSRQDLTIVSSKIMNTQSQFYPSLNSQINLGISRTDKVFPNHKHTFTQMPFSLTLNDGYDPFNKTVQARQVCTISHFYSASNKEPYLSSTFYSGKNFKALPPYTLNPEIPEKPPSKHKPTVINNQLYLSPLKHHPNQSKLYKMAAENRKLANQHLLQKQQPEETSNAKVFKFEQSPHQESTFLHRRFLSGAERSILAPLNADTLHFPFDSTKQAIHSFLWNRDRDMAQGEKQKEEGELEKKKDIIIRLNNQVRAQNRPKTQSPGYSRDNTKNLDLSQHLSSLYIGGISSLVEKVQVVSKKQKLEKSQIQKETIEEVLEVSELKNSVQISQELKETLKGNNDSILGGCEIDLNIKTPDKNTRVELLQINGKKMTRFNIPCFIPEPLRSKQKTKHLDSARSSLQEDLSLTRNSFTAERRRLFPKQNDDIIHVTEEVARPPTQTIFRISSPTKYLIEPGTRQGYQGSASSQSMRRRVVFNVSRMNQPQAFSQESVMQPSESFVGSSCKNLKFRKSDDVKQKEVLELAKETIENIEKKVCIEITKRYTQPTAKSEPPEAPLHRTQNQLEKQSTFKISETILAQQQEKAINKEVQKLKSTQLNLDLKDLPWMESQKVKERLFQKNPMAFTNAQMMNLNPSQMPTNPLKKKILIALKANKQALATRNFNYPNHSNHSITPLNRQLSKIDTEELIQNKRFSDSIKSMSRQSDKHHTLQLVPLIPIDPKVEVQKKVLKTRKKVKIVKPPIEIPMPVTHAYHQQSSADLTIGGGNFRYEEEPEFVYLMPVEKHPFISLPSDYACFEIVHPTQSLLDLGSQTIVSSQDPAAAITSSLVTPAQAHDSEIGSKPSLQDTQPKQARKEVYKNFSQPPLPPQSILKKQTTLSDKGK
ncbi:hypothetical protein FGO68_gene10146 [Halteria grandinella]|uniref:Uncharacterized protein n=1 Tax=Halteria grandinella TaxID=5974 RepID=A0A8J8T770_HALGN|nr:hypothetical protein FGO68_gene10146 [Halteria grandinella]